MNIEVLFFGKLRELAVRRRVVSITDGARLIDLVDWLVKEYGADFREEINHKERWHFLINGRYYNPLDGMEVPLKDGAVVAMLPLLAGG
jgi:molybdopterin converting factor small subunit